jgi:hypothetical protein
MRKALLSARLFRLPGLLLARHRGVERQVQRQHVDPLLAQYTKAAVGRVVAMSWQPLTPALSPQAGRGRTLRPFWRERGRGRARGSKREVIDAAAEAEIARRAATAADTVLRRHA